MSADLVTFLRARLDEDAQTAQAAKPGPWHVEEDRQALTRWVANEERTLEVGLGYVGNRTQGDAAHIARHDPARVLRDVEAKRRVVYECAYWNERAMSEAIDPPEFPQPGLDMGLLLDAMNPILRHLAAVYADNPDYREEWRP